MVPSLSFLTFSTIIIANFASANPIHVIRQVTNSTAVANTSCIVTEYAQIAAAVKDCRNITLQDVYAPPNSSIELKLKQGSTVTFAGTTSFGYTNSSTFKPMLISGKNITVQGAPGHVIDGNGSMYWDGQGSNGGVPKPNQFLVLKAVTKSSTIRNLNIQNYPVHGIITNGCSDLAISGIMLDNSLGDAPNAVSGGKPASHNSDGFDIGQSTNRTTISDSQVYNQDDCVAVTSGDNIAITNMLCSGGHGLSIGSIGGKALNSVSNVYFGSSRIINSQNGARIKSNFNTTGSIANITYENIELVNIERYGVDLQQDYLNGGPTGTPSNGVLVDNVVFRNVTGDMGDAKKGMAYMVLCGAGSCKDVRFEGTGVVNGGKQASVCNVPESGCPR